MSREILFRGKCFNTGEWVEGFLGIEVPDEFVIQQFSFDEYFKSECIDQYAVKPETVGQYTGLKDKNGKKIFEGDVVKGASEYFCNSSLNQKAVVLYDRGQFVFAFGETLTDCKQLEDFEVVAGWNGDVEVIGNIYDNRELLRGGKQWMI